MSLTFSEDGKTFTAAAPVRLFSAPISASPENTAIAQQYLVSADGQRFLVVAGPDGESPVRMEAR